MSKWFVLREPNIAKCGAKCKAPVVGIPIAHLVFWGLTRECYGSTLAPMNGFRVLTMNSTYEILLDDQGVHHVKAVAAVGKGKILLGKAHPCVCQPWPPVHAHLLHFVPVEGEPWPHPKGHSLHTSSVVSFTPIEEFS